MIVDNKYIFKVSFIKTLEVIMERMKTIKEQVYEKLKSDILNGTYKPGERIQELKIAKKLNVSRSPVREAIKELIGEGLLVSVPNKSITVKKLSVKEIKDIFDFRNITEKYAIEKTIDNLDDRIIKRLESIKSDFKKLYEDDDLHRYCKVDSEFHNYLIKSSGNALLHQVVSNVMALIEQFRVISLSSNQRFEESIDEHVTIIDSILKKDKKNACSVCIRHLDLAKDEIISYLNNKK